VITGSGRIELQTLQIDAMPWRGKNRA